MVSSADDGYSIYRATPTPLGINKALLYSPAGGYRSSIAISSNSQWPNKEKQVPGASPYFNAGPKDGTGSIEQAKTSSGKEKVGSSNGKIQRGAKATTLVESPLAAAHLHPPAKDGFTYSATSQKRSIKDSTPKIQLNQIPVTILPERSRSLFRFTHFNEMQSKVFNDIHCLSDNCVISSPTGSGKTVLFELALLRSLRENNEHKILYLAPTKALCTERYNDWKSRIGGLNISIGALTGDTPLNEVERVRNSDIIISTPEKWDMLSRRWSDYQKLFNLVKLLLIDEVHILKDSRGSVLETLVTRMKRLCKGMRIIALSATISNVGDISKWIALNDNNQKPANNFSFDDSYRAVKLDKLVFGYQKDSDNIYYSDVSLNSKLDEIISIHSLGKPILIFCPTRNSAIKTAKYLGQKSTTTYSNITLNIKENDLKKLVSSGVAYHHAGLTYSDRQEVEGGFLSGKLKIICSTSTLATGINLPAYLVIIKGTKCWNNGSFEEYSEIDLLQMMGRAGRPQFENEGKAIILTSKEHKLRYQRLIDGTEKVESHLHLSFIENMAAEITLGTIQSEADAMNWLRSTFFYVRFIENPTYYQNISGEELDLSRRLYNFCISNLNELLKKNIIDSDSTSKFKPTAFALAMSRHYVLFSTMKDLLSSQKRKSLSQVLDLLSKSKDMSDIRMKSQETKLFKDVNSSPLLKFPIKSKTLENQDKVLLLIQYELGGLEFPSYTDASKLYSSFHNDLFQVFRQAIRIVRCMIDVFREQKDSISLINAMSLNRSIIGKCWENSPMELRQLEGIGLANVRKFVNHNVSSLKDAQSLTPQQIEYYLGCKIGSGNKVQAALSSLPKVSVKLNPGASTVNGSNTYVQLSLSISITVSNPKASCSWKRQSVMLNIITELSNGTLVDFRRMPISNFSQLLPKGFNLVIPITPECNNINVYVCAESIAGTETKYTIKVADYVDKWKLSSLKIEEPNKNTKVSIPPKIYSAESVETSSEMSDIDLDEVFRAVEQDVEAKRIARTKLGKSNFFSQPKRETPKPESSTLLLGNRKRQRLKNGNYMCVHSCKDRSRCRHLCCKEGIPEKLFKRKSRSISEDPINFKFDKVIEEVLDEDTIIYKSITDITNVSGGSFPIEKAGMGNVPNDKGSSSLKCLSVSDKKEVQPDCQSGVINRKQNKNSDLISMSKKESKPRKVSLTPKNNILDLDTLGMFESSDSDLESYHLNATRLKKIKLDKTSKKKSTKRVFSIETNSDSGEVSDRDNHPKNGTKMQRKGSQGQISIENESHFDLLESHNLSSLLSQQKSSMMETNLKKAGKKKDQEEEIQNAGTEESFLEDFFGSDVIFE